MKKLSLILVQLSEDFSLKFIPEHLKTDRIHKTVRVKDKNIYKQVKEK